ELNNHRDFFDGERIGINPTARIVLGEDTTLDLAYEYIDHERFVDRGIPSNDAGDPALQLIDITFGDPEDNFTQLEAHVLRANIQHRFSDALKGNFNVSYGDYDKVYSNLFAVGFDEAANTVALDGYIDTTQRENFIVSGNLAGEFETGEILHTVLVGAEYIDTVNNNDRFNAFFDQTQDDVEFFTATRPLSISGGVGVNASGNQTINDFSDLNDDTEADVTVYSLFIQDEIELTSWLNVVLGARYDRFEITVDNIETFIDTGERDILSRTDEEISPRVGLILKPQENISIYGSYSESFLPRSGEQFADINPPNDALDPNTFENLEAGIKWDAADRVSFTAAIFEVRQSSPQVSDNDPGTLDVIDTQVQGFEFQVKGEVTPWWFVTAGYSYLDGEQANSDLRPRELPENMFSIWNQFQPTERLGIGLGLIAQDESFADNGNTVTLPSYERVDIAAFYDVTDTVRVQVNIENLFDQDYFPNAHTADNLTVGAPLNALFTLRARY
ncbi:MAG: TonB-dependent receptor, partial [Pseudomonadota bacterium]